MTEFFTKDYTGEAFQLFGSLHIIALTIILLFNLSFIIVRRNPDGRLRKFLRYSMAIILVCNEIGWHIWNWATGQWTVQTMLPLHLCSVFVSFNSYMLISRNYLFIAHKPRTASLMDILPPWPILHHLH